MWWWWGLYALRWRWIRWLSRWVLGKSRQPDILGIIHAHYELSCFYHKGARCWEGQEDSLHHRNRRTIGGRPSARYNLGAIEKDNGNGRHERAKMHWFITARLGISFSKEEDVAAARAYQAWSWSQFNKSNQPPPPSPNNPAKQTSTDRAQ